MRWKFETKANKVYANKISKEAEEDAAKIMPTTFSLDIELEEKNILSAITNSYRFAFSRDCVKGIKFSIAGEIFDLIAPILSRSTLLLASFIRLNIVYNSNYIEITEKDYVGFSGLKRDCFYDAINEAIKNKIIARTTRKSIYIVNHNMIFKGDVGEFVAKYKIKYPNGCRLDNAGKVILEH